MARFGARPTILTAALTGCAVMVVIQLLDSRALHETLSVADGRRVTIESSGVEVPDVTAYCLGCHDGSIAPAARIRLAEYTASSHSFLDMPSRSGWARAHPVRISYPTHRDGFHAGGPIASEIVLVDGTVTCIACHDCSRRDRRLVVDNRRSRLCLSCHDK